MSLAHRTVRNTTILFVARTLARMLVLLVFLLQQHYLGAYRYGEFGVIVVFSNLSGIVSDLGLQIVYLREGSRDNARLKSLLAAVLAAKVPLLAASFLTLWLMAGADRPSLLFVFWPAFALMTATSVANVLRSTFFATGEIRYEAVATIMEALILLVGTFLVAHARLGLSAYLWVYAASYAATCVYAPLVIARRYFRPEVHIDPVLVRQLLRLSLPFALVFFLNTVYFRIDVVILNAMRGPTQVGYYQAAYKFLDGFSFVPQTVMNAVFPALAVLHLGELERMRRAYTATCRLLALVAMPIALALGFGAGPLLTFLHVYHQSVPSLQILAFALVFLFVNNTYVFGLGAMDRQGDTVRLSVMSIVVNVVLNLILIPLYSRPDGYLGSSWATVITEVFLLIAGYWMVRRRLDHQLPWLRPFLPIVVSGGLMAGIILVLAGQSVFWTVPLAGLFYLGALVVTGGVTTEELRTARASLGRRLRPASGG